MSSSRRERPFGTTRTLAWGLSLRTCSARGSVETVKASKSEKPLKFRLKIASTWSSVAFPFRKIELCRAYSGAKMKSS